jgi:hypothetical protein
MDELEALLLTPDADRVTRERALSAAEYTIGRVGTLHNPSFLLTLEMPKTDFQPLHAIVSRLPQCIHTTI